MIHALSKPQKKPVSQKSIMVLTKHTLLFLALKALLYLSVVAKTPSLYKRALKIGNCSPKIEIANGSFAVTDKNLKKAVGPRGGGKELLEAICKALEDPKTCGKVADSEIKKCKAQINQATQGVSGKDLVKKWNALCDSNGNPKQQG
ncbi:hypothetical protein PTTG_12644, partial [Puccinia triticina 1-1 BBBD Race 1]